MMKSKAEEMVGPIWGPNESDSAQLTCPEHFLLERLCALNAFSDFSIFVESSRLSLLTVRMFVGLMDDDGKERREKAR